MNFDFSNPALISSIVAVVLLTIVAVALATRHSRVQSRNLHTRFGSEYDFVLEHSPSRRKGEAILLAREKRVHLLKIHELNATQRAHYFAAWDLVRSRFIEHPRGAVVEADELLTSLMQARGFPVERFEQRAADLSVDHAQVVDTYRSANAIAIRAGKNNATTEELRTAMVHYRTIFEDLLQIDTPISEARVA